MQLQNNGLNGLGKVFSETKVGSFLSGLFSGIDSSPLGMIGMVHTICRIGKMMISGMDMAVGDNFRIGDGILTQTETTNLDNWDANHFTPFVKNLLSEANTAFSTSSNTANQLIKINAVLNKMCAVRNHFSVTIDNSLTITGKRIKNEYIDLAFQPIEEYITGKLTTNTGLIKSSVIANMASFSFGSLITQSTVTSFYCDTYQQKKSTWGTPVTESGGLELELDPIDFPSNSGVVSPGIESKDNTGLIIGGIALLTIGIAVLSGKKSKKK